MVSKDPYDDPRWKAYAAHARKSLEPMVRDSAFCLSLYTGKVDPKMAIETGYMVLLDKPIIAVVSPGAKMPDKLARVADEIVEGELGDPDFEERMKAAVDRVKARLEGRTVTFDYDEGPE